MIHTYSVFVFAAWFATTLAGVVFSHYGYLEAASVFLPLGSLASCYAIVFKIGRVVLNGNTKDDHRASYADIVVCFTIWVFSHTNLLFMVWMWDPSNAFAHIAAASTSEAWVRLNVLAIYLATGIGQGYASAISIAAETVSAYPAYITYLFAILYIGHGISTASAYIVTTMKKINKRLA